MPKKALTLAEEQASYREQLREQEAKQDDLWDIIRPLMAKQRTTGRALTETEKSDLSRALYDHDWARKQIDTLRSLLRDVDRQIERRAENERLYPTANAVTVLDPDGACIKATGGKISFRAFLWEQGTPQALKVAAMKLDYLDAEHGRDYWTMICMVEDPKLLKGTRLVPADRSLPESA